MTDVSATLSGLEHWCGVFAARPSLFPQAVAFARREWDGASVWLSRGFVGSSSALRPRSRRFRVRSFRMALVEPACKHPAGSPTPEPSTAVFEVCCGTVILQSSRVYSLSLGSLQQRPRISVSPDPFGAARTHNSTRTAIILVCVDSFIRLLTAKHAMVTPSIVPRSHAHDITHSSGYGLSSPVTVWLLQQERLSNPGGLRWSPHLLPISHTHHSNLESLQAHIRKTAASALSCSCVAVGVLDRLLKSKSQLCVSLGPNL